MARILVLSNIVPYPPHGGVHLRIFNLVMRIARVHEVTLGCHAWDERDRDGAAWLSNQGIRTVTAPLGAANWRHIAPALRSLVAAEPPEIVQYRTPELNALVATEPFDILQIEETLLAPYARFLPGNATTKRVLVFHNVHLLQERRLAAIAKTLSMQAWRTANALLMSRYEPRIAQSFDRNIAVSETDRGLLLERAPDLSIDVLPNGVDTTTLCVLPEPPEKQAILFVGSLNYAPCIDAVQWLVTEILPILRRDHPALEVWIVGKNPPPEVTALAADRVFVTGYVSDLTPFYLRAAVAVVPLRAGGGSRLKILEAMALGRPVVSTTVGAEGLKVTDKQDILLADDCATFSGSVSHLLLNRGKWRMLAQNGRRFVEESHDWDMIASRQLSIYDQILENT